MPPQITDDESSDVNSNYGAPDPVVPAPKVKQEKVKEKEKRGKSKSKTPIEEPEALEVESEKNDNEEDDDEELPEDEYVVEKITNHVVDEDTGEIKYEVKWEGFDKRADRTWEPEENLETASGILSEYLASVGGKELIMSAWEEKKAEAAGKKGKKRGRVSTGTHENGAKRGRKSKDHPASATPPSSAFAADFKPPTGSWEDAVVAIDACEGSEGSVVVYLTWKGGHKTQHPLAQVYKRCPQKMLHFYESHLVFKKNEDMA
ncbi:putative chromatin-associated protein swi6 [Rhexocercosporidium sp. MPI-PUGE-AT-0058]|nr:putative chromatin-associated protein swi6 [Rhexocercosporidium sp. MPI-PUGE-AT-0058]